ncbi:hypothetical protein ACFYMR_12070 [Streptomyces albogriseolus]
MNGARRARVHHAQHPGLALRTLSDPWLEYPALAAGQVPPSSRP